MISALQERSTSAKLNPYTGLRSPVITARCAHVRSCISTLPIKDLHQFFPYLLSNIFGFDHSGGWGLCAFNKNIHSDFPLVLQFLSPGGDIFQLISKLDADNFIYEFPIECLPLPSQQALTEGIVPPFYANKVQLSYSVDNAPTHIFLSAFEYYLFHFAYFLVNLQCQQWSRMPVNISECLYTSMLDAYLHYFLPFTGSIPEPLTASQLQSSPHHHLGSTPPGSSFYGPLYGSPGSWHGDSYRESSRRAVKLDSSGFDGTMQEDAEASQSEIFIQVLVEFWLNQFSYDGTQGDLLNQVQIPSKEHLSLLRCLLKQVHYFSNGFTYCSFSPTSSMLTSLTPATDALRGSVMAVFFQKRLYRFLKYSFKHLPLDFTFRYILELWLTFIQPWRYLDPNKESVENKLSLKTNKEKWKSFVFNNFPFYTTLLVEFLHRCFHLDLTSTNHVMLLYRTTKVFAQTDVMAFIVYGESLLLSHDSGRQTSPISRGSPKVSSIKAVFVNCDGPMFQYSPIFNENNMHILQLVQSLRQKIHHARVALAQRFTPSAHHSHSTVQPPTSPSLSPSLSSSLSNFSPSLPSKTSTAPVRSQPQIKQSLLKSAWGWLVEAFSDDPVYGTRVAPTQMQSDPRRLVELLSKSDEVLTKMFKLPDYTASPGSHDGSPVLGKAVLTQATSFADTGTPPVNLMPEYIKGTSNLSPQGKMQVMQGLRKCSSLDIHYMGDPLLQPIRSYENASLVRVLHHLSCGLNDRYAVQLMNVGTSKSIFCKLLLQLLAPPPPMPHAAFFTVDDSQDQPPSTPVSHVTPVFTVPTHGPLTPVTCRSPRINLRPLASYYTLTYIFLAVLLVWLLAVPLWLDVLLILLFLFIFCCVSLIVYGTSPQKSRKKQQ